MSLAQEQLLFSNQEWCEFKHGTMASSVYRFAAQNNLQDVQPCSLNKCVQDSIKDDRKIKAYWPAHSS